MDIVNEFDKKMAWTEGEQSYDFLAGREQGLIEGRKLAKAYVHHRQEADVETSEQILRLRRENAALREVIDAAREALSRDVLGQTMAHNFESLAAIVRKSVDQYNEMEREQDQHTCECECELNEECYQDCEECSD